MKLFNKMCGFDFAHSILMHRRKNKSISLVMYTVLERVGQRVRYKFNKRFSLT